LTSHTENFGNAVVEAMAAGCPVLVSTEVNLAPQIRSARAGVVTGLSIDEIAIALAGLLDDSHQREALRLRAREFARRFDWSVVAPQLVNTFYEVARTRNGHSVAVA
jgi:glycosyltransferase involved in cell wall biosynthesis